MTQTPKNKNYETDVAKSVHEQTWSTPLKTKATLQTHLISLTRVVRIAQHTGSCTHTQTQNTTPGIFNVLLTPHNTKAYMQ